MAKYFLNEAEIENLQVPKIDECAQVFYHWEKAATRMILGISKLQSSWIFQQPVDPEKL